MQRMFAFGRVWVMAAGLAAFAVLLLSPKPAAAWWDRPGWGWHAGWGWHPGWGYHWRRCCWRPGVVVVRRPWIPGHWHGSWWVPGHWAW